MLYQETIVNPILKIPPDVLFLSVGLPAQSASVCRCYHTPMRFFHRRWDASDPGLVLLSDRSMALSSAEAEYMAASFAACEAIWMRMILVGLFGSDRKSVV